MEITNPGFETGTAQGWTLGTDMTVWSSKKFAGTYSVVCRGAAGETRLLHDSVECAPNREITANCQYKQGRASSGDNPGAVILQWLDAGNNILAEDFGNVIDSASNGDWFQSTVTATAPANTTQVRVGLWTDRTDGASDHFSCVDQFSWDYDFDRSVTLAAPPDGTTYTQGDYVQLAVSITGSTPAVTSVTYYDNGVQLEVFTTAPYGTNKNDFTLGDHDIYADVLFADGSNLLTATHTITISATPPPPPETREFNASCAYTYLIGSNMQGISAAVPATALITAVEAVVDYTVDALVRSKDFLADVEDSNPSVLFDVTNDADLVMILVRDDGETYTRFGNPVTAEIPLDRSDFVETETGISEEKKWTVMESGETSVTIGETETLFGESPVALADFLDMGLGFRFLPRLGSKPSYADSGDGCFRFKINKIRIRVYFDAGSVEYYFASADKTQVIKGELVHSYVFDGSFETADASGVLELQPTLEIIDGTQTWIGDDWTIHSAYPPTDDNYIGDVADREAADGVGMSYNGLPTQQAIVDNRSRYEIITNNFYGDVNLESMYGVHGLPRAFAYNGEFFHRIYTQADPEKDKPRHVAHHHEHLALGYSDGRVDISVVGEPYNFAGEEGASSWAIGDGVTGLLSLSGTILGVFCNKSIWGISGTTIDNFATQVIVPKLGAIEYTITDMGFPVYANAYGIYTLAQAQEYGDYLGSPMSQDVSPWLRPRLVRRYTSDKEVVVAWPVRSKNQYRLAFADGYVLSMTLNAGQQSAPTFSLQMYDIPPEDFGDD